MTKKNVSIEPFSAHAVNGDDGGFLPARQFRRDSGNRGWLAKLGSVLRRWDDIRRSRRALHQMTDWELRDIGLRRDEARAEYRKSFLFD